MISSPETINVNMLLNTVFFKSHTPPRHLYFILSIKQNIRSLYKKAELPVKPASPAFNFIHQINTAPTLVSFLFILNTFSSYIVATAFVFTHTLNPRFMPPKAV